MIRRNGKKKQGFNNGEISSQMVRNILSTYFIAEKK
jgi:hypothetical protein